MTQAKIKSVLKNGQIYWKDDDALAVYCRRTNFMMLRDRFGFLNRFSGFDISDADDPFPRRDYTGSFSDIIYRRGEELFLRAKSEGRALYVLWSGGVDSTAVLLSILHAAGDDGGRVHVVYTLSSIDEYPKFHRHLKATGRHLHLVTAEEFTGFCARAAETDHVITGFPADQLFGSIVGQGNDIVHDADWRTWVKEPQAVGQFEAAFQHYGLPVKTMTQFLWFANFSFKWDFVVHFLPQICGIVRENVIPFFDTREFQDWSVSNFDRLHIHDQKVRATYKRDMKNFIMELFPDADYLRKGKTGSIGYSRTMEGYYGEGVRTIRPFLALLDDNGVSVHRYSRDVPGRDQSRVEQVMATRILLPYRKKR